MLSFNDKISIRQLQILLILEIFGVGFIILPKKVALFANQDGWIIVILSTIIAMIIALTITSLAQMFPKDSFYDYSSKIMSRPIGLILTLGFILKIILTVAMELRLFCEIIKETILPRTPFSVVSFVMLLASGYCASKGFETRARLAEILIIIVFLPLTIILLFSLLKLNFSNLLPILINSNTDFIRGAFLSTIFFTGIEFCLLVYPYVNNPKKVQKSVIATILYIGLFMLFITIITIAKFGAENLKHQSWPLIEFIEMINLPGSFMEGQGAAIMSFWIISVFAFVNASLFFLSLLVKDVIKKGSTENYIIIGLIAIFIVSLLPQNIDDVLKIMNLIFITLGIAYLFILPFIMLIVAKLRRLK